MSDREALAAALKLIEKKALRYPGPWRTTWYAARERLAQLPGKCEGSWHGEPRIETNCAPCHGYGRVYPSELVERIARIFYDSDVNAIDPGGPIVPWQRVLEDAPRSPWHVAAVAVLDALNREDT